MSQRTGGKYSLDIRRATDDRACAWIHERRYRTRYGWMMAIRHVRDTSEWISYQLGGKAAEIIIIANARSKP